MSKFYNFREEIINGVTIPAGTALKDIGDGAIHQMLRFELPTRLHHCGSKHIDLYPHQVGDKWEFDSYAAAMRERGVYREGDFYPLIWWPLGGYTICIPMNALSGEVYHLH